VRIGGSGEVASNLARKLEQKKQALRSMPLFSKLHERELLRIMQVADVLEFGPGDCVVREGDRGDELFIVIDGMLEILRGEQVLSEVGPGEHFGEMALIRSTPRSATVRSLDVSELIAIRRSEFFSILRKEHELAVKLLWQFLGVLADRLDQTSRDLSTAKEELAAEDISDAIAEDVEETSSEARLSLADRLFDENTAPEGMAPLSAGVRGSTESGAARDSSPLGAGEPTAK
jgi:CRP-like cAMP-binding protein